MTDLCGFTAASAWLKGFSVERNLFGTLIFYVLTILIVQGGVKQGIERWSTDSCLLYLCCLPCCLSTS